MTTYRVPHFLVIGAQRSGTSWLHRELNRHPEISMPPLKELHYFDYVDRHHYHWNEKRRYTQHLQKAMEDIKKLKINPHRALFYWKYFVGRRSDRWYASLFDSKKGTNKITGEATPAYANLSLEMWTHVRAAFPEIKLIFIMRDPVERVWSNLVRKEVRNKGCHISVLTDQKIRAALENKLYYVNSTYSETIETIESVFDQGSILYLFYDELKENPGSLYDRLCAFLEVSQLEDGVVDVKNANAASSNLAEEIPDQVVQLVMDNMRGEYVWLSNRFSGGYPHSWVSRYPKL